MTHRKKTVVYLMVSLPPYRSSVCQRVRESLPKIDLIAAITHHPLEGDRWPPVSMQVVPQVLFAPEQVPGPMSVRDHLRDIGKAVRVLQWLSAVRPAAVVVHGYNDATRLLTIAWCNATGTPVLLAGDSNIKADNPRGVRKMVKSAYLHALLRVVDAALPFGTLGELYFRRYGMPAARIFKYPAEPDYGLIAGESRRRVDQVVARLGLRPQRRRILYSGRLAVEKRVDLLISAYLRLFADRNDWDLLILGSGPEHDRLVRLVPPAIAEQVRFIAAMSDPADVFAVYHASDVLVLPSDHEPWALVVNEAAAAGLAIVCSDVVGAAANLVREGVNGRTFQKGNLDQLTAALADVTAEQNLQRYQSASLAVIDDWRRQADPVAGIAAALRSAGVL